MSLTTAATLRVDLYEGTESPPLASTDRFSALTGCWRRASPSPAPH